MSSPTPVDWLSDLELRSSDRKFPDRALLYQGVVDQGSLELRGKVLDPKLQQVQIEHFAGKRLVQIQVVPVKRGRFCLPLNLLRGHNDLILGAFDDSGRAQARHIVYRTAWRERAEVVLVALALALILRSFVAQAFEIPSESMLPTFARGDYILVDKFYHRFEAPRRGDIVVFDSPEKPGEFFIKRVIGIPGDELSIAGSRVFLGETLLKEDYLDVSAKLADVDRSKPKRWTIGKGRYFLLGDNRLNSKDSRVWGALARDRIVGRALARYWPPHTMGWIQ